MEERGWEWLPQGGHDATLPRLDDGTGIRGLPKIQELPKIDGLPKLPVAVQPRPEFYALLDSAVSARSRRTVLVCAAAGMGKTSLLVDWVEKGAGGAGTAVAWLTLAPGDNDPDILERRMADSIVQAAVAERADAGIVFGAGGDSPLAEPFRRIAECGRSTVLVLDDLDAITDVESLRRLSDLVETAPENLTVILAARRTPELPLAKYATDGQLTTVAWRYLALDREAIAAILAEHRCVVTEADLDAVLEFTGGWASAVRLVGMRITQLGDAGSGLADLVRFPQRMSDYIVGQVLDGLPDNLLRFLQATSVVDWFTPALAEELDEANVHSVLAERERYCVPILKVADRTELRYSWHPFLRAHLRAELRATDPGRYEQLHGIAARWHRAARHPLIALPHLLEAADDEAVADFVNHDGAGVVFGGRADEMFEQLGVRYGDLPGVRYLRALAALECNYPDAARAHLRAVEHASVNGGHGQVFAGAEAFGAALHIAIDTISGRPMPTECIEMLERWTGSVSVDVDCYIAIQRSVGLMLLGDLSSSERILREALTLGEVGAHPRLVMRCLTRLSVVAGIRGDLATMIARAEHALHYAVDHGVLDSIDTYQSAAVVCLDIYLRGEQLHEDHPAFEVVTHPAQHRRPDGTTAPVSGGHSEVAFGILRARRTSPLSVEDADALGKALVGLLARGAQSGLSNTLVTPVVSVLLEAGRITAATEIVDLARRAFGEVPDVTVADAMVAAAQNDSAAAWKLLESLLESPIGLHPALSVRAWILAAVLAKREDRWDDAVSAIRRAVEIAEPNVIIGPFLDSGRDAADLLTMVPAAPEYSQSFVDRVRSKLATSKVSGNPGLTRSETVILAELATGRQLRMIAKDLHVSLNTVRTHTRNIYRKLDASSRAEALAAAARLGLLT